MKRLALFLSLLVFAALFTGCASSGLSTKTIAGSYNAAPTRRNAQELKLFLKADRTFLMYARQPSASSSWKLVKQGRWKASGRTLKLQAPSASDEKYKIQGFAESLTSSKRNSPQFRKETNIR
jgi:hypothetical protein